MTMFKRFRRQSTLTFNVLSLDGTILSFELESRSTGAEVLERALEASGVRGEREFFGLVSPSDSDPRWLSLQKPLKKQLAGGAPYSANLRVCMYPRDHQSITEPSTRHMLYLQVKQDMYTGRLLCQNNQLLYRIAGLALQCEIGDFTAQTCGLTYVSEFELLPVLTRSTEESISQLHRLNRGRASEECALELLDLVQTLPTYGTISYNVQDSSRQSVCVCLSPIGVKVQQRNTERASFEWDSIERITSRGKGVTFHISASHTLAPYQVQFICQNSTMSHNISLHCRYLLESYCVPVVEIERPKSRLKRWFSSRRSLRRRPSPMRRHFKDANGTARGVLNVRRASFGGDLTSPSMTTVTASSRMSLRASSRTDSKLVIYGSGGLASAAGNSTQTTPNHHTLKLESSDLRNSGVHQIEPLGATPTHRGPATTPTHQGPTVTPTYRGHSATPTHQGHDATPTHRSQGATPTHRGSVGDVEHKSLSAVLRSHTHSGRVSPTTGASFNSTEPATSTSTSTRVGQRQLPLLSEFGSPTRTSSGNVRERGGVGTHQRSRVTSSNSQGSLTRQKALSDYERPPKVEWYHSDLVSPQEKGNFSGIGATSRSTTSTDALSRNSSGRSYTRSDSVDQVHNYKHSTSNQYINSDRSTNQMQRFHHSQSVDQIERHTAVRHRHHHHHRSHQRYPPGREAAGNGQSPRSHHTGQTRSTRSSSDLTVQRKQSNSLPRDTPPQLQEEDEPEGQSTYRYIDRNHPARPQNRGQYRLSLPESSYYDNSARPTRHTNSRRSRKALTNTGTFVSSGSLSQPADFGLGGMSSKLGSIASLEYQASFAELSQSDVTSVIDPHTRSFIFGGSQTNSQGTIL